MQFSFYLISSSLLELTERNGVQVIQHMLVNTLYMKYVIDNFRPLPVVINVVYKSFFDLSMIESVRFCV